MKTAAIILTWNNVNETLDCIKSLLRLQEESPARIIIVDNASELKYQRELEDGLKEISVDFAIIEEDEIEKIENLPSQRFILLKNSSNYGYAGGNNRGIKLALKDRSLNYIWILNNDTVVERNTLGALLRRAEPSCLYCLSCNDRSANCGYEDKYASYWKGF